MNNVKFKLKSYEGFIDFIRERGVIGLAVGFVLGSAISKIVTSFVGDLMNPLISILLGSAGSFKEASFTVRNIDVRWGSFLGSIVDFLVIAFVIYLVVKILGIEKLDKKRK